MASRLELLKKTEAQVTDLITQNKGYEALRLIVTISNRYHSMKAYDEALRVAYDYTIALLNNKEGIPNQGVGFEAAKNYITLLDKSQKMDDATAANIKTIFTSFIPPTTPTPSTTTTTTTDDSSSTTSSDKPIITPYLDFMRSAIQLTRKMIKILLETPKSNTTMGIDDDNDSTIETINKLKKIDAGFNNTIAMFCFKYKYYDLGNQHFVYAGMPVQHVLQVAPIITTLSSHECGLAVLRLVAMYLCLYDDYIFLQEQVITHAEKFLTTLLLKLTSKSIQPLSLYLNCAQNLITTAKLGDLKTFETVCTVYADVIDKSPDPLIAQFIDRVGELYCHLPKQKGLLDSLFG